MIYNSARGEKLILEFYDSCLEELQIDYDEQVVETRFGSTHVLILGPPDGKPIFMLHGGNSINLETLVWYLPLSKKYRIYAPDLIGHPGKSAQVQLSIKDLSYGQWAADVVEAFGLAPVVFHGTSYGGSITLYTGAYKPKIIEKAILVVPGSIAMASKLTMATKVFGPLMMYKLLGGRKQLEQFVRQIAKEPSEVTIKGFQYSFDYLKMNDLLPTISKEKLEGFQAETLLFAADKDIFFPANKVVPKSKDIIPNLKNIVVLENSTHYPTPELIDDINQQTQDFLGL